MHTSKTDDAIMLMPMLGTGGGDHHPSCQGDGRGNPKRHARRGASSRSSAASGTRKGAISKVVGGVSVLVTYGSQLLALLLVLAPLLLVLSPYTLYPILGMVAATATREEECSVGMSMGMVLVCV